METTRPIGDERSETTTVAPGPVRAPVLLPLAVGLGIGIVSWLIGEWAEGVFAPRSRAAIILNNVPTRLISDASRASADIKNVALSSGLFGALLGAALGLSGGQAGRSGVAARRAALVGLAGGGIVGSGMSLALTTLYYRSFLHYTPDGLTEPMLMHAGIWGTIGAVGGLAFGMGSGGPGQSARGLVGGLVGAVLGAVLYEVVGAVAFPMSRTFQPTAAAWTPRLMARLLVASLTAVVAALAVADPKRTKPTA